MEEGKILQLPNNSDNVDLKTILKRISNSLDKLDFPVLTGKELNKINASDMVVHVCEAILNLNEDFIKKGEKIHVYNGRFWDKIKSDDLKKFLINCSIQCGVNGSEAKKVTFGDLVNSQFMYAMDSYFIPFSDGVKINLSEGTFHIKKEERVIKEFQKEDYIFYQLPFTYEKDAGCPMFDEYLNYVLDKESHQTLYSFLAYAMLGNQAPNLEKALFLEGDGGTGKSVCLRVVTALFGKDNISSVPLSKFGSKEGTYVGYMEGKLLNYASETGKDFAVEIFKQVVSKEPTMVRIPYAKQPYEVHDLPSLIFNVNMFPRSRETTNAVYRRVIILVFDKVIPSSKKDIDLADKVINNELPGIFNKILTAMDDLLGGGKIPISKRSKLALEDYRVSDDSVYSFIHRWGYVPCQINKIPFETMYQAYSSFCSLGGNSRVGNNKFSTLIRRLGFEIDTDRPKNIFASKENDKNM